MSCIEDCDELDDIRQDISQDLQALRTEVGDEIEALRREIRALWANLNGR